MHNLDHYYAIAAINFRASVKRGEELYRNRHKSAEFEKILPPEMTMADYYAERDSELHFKMDKDEKLDVVELNEIEQIRARENALDYKILSISIEPILVESLYQYGFAEMIMKRKDDNDSMILAQHYREELMDFLNEKKDLNLESDMEKIVRNAFYDANIFLLQDEEDKNNPQTLSL